RLNRLRHLVERCCDDVESTGGQIPEGSLIGRGIRGLNEPRLDAEVPFCSRKRSDHIVDRPFVSGLLRADQCYLLARRVRDQTITGRESEASETGTGCHQELLTGDIHAEWTLAGGIVSHRCHSSLRQRTQGGTPRQPNACTL